MISRLIIPAASSHPMYDGSRRGINHRSQTHKVTRSVYRVDDAVSVCVFKKKQKKEREGECPSPPPLHPRSFWQHHMVTHPLPCGRGQGSHTHDASLQCD